jgi:hypothetical protein
VFTARYVLHSAHTTVFMCFVWIWEQTAIISLYSIDWLVFIIETGCVYCAVRSTFYVLPTQCIYVFCVDLRTNSDYFTVQQWLVSFYNGDESAYCVVRTGSLYGSLHFVFKRLKYNNKHNTMCTLPELYVYFIVMLLLVTSFGLRRPPSGQYLQKERKMPVHVVQNS